jgi:PAP2 superfamily
VVDRRRRALTLLWARTRRQAAPKWWQELTLIGVLYGVYTLTRDALPRHETAAFHRAATVVSIERWLHIDAEHWANQLVARTHWLAYGCDYYYSTLHFAVTLGVLVWLYRAHPTRYRSIRSVLVITTLVALVGFTLMPLAPPRMLPGYVDTVVHLHTWGSLASPSVAKASNEFAAMPSLHIGWSLWCAFAIVGLARRRWVRVLGALYPLATLFVILGTANHYVLDAVGGAAALAAAIVTQRLASGRAAYLDLPIHLPEREPEPEPGLLVA